MVLSFLLFFFFLYSTKAENLIAVGNKKLKKPQTSKEITFLLVTMAAKTSRIEEITKEFSKSYKLRKGKNINV